MKIIPAKLLFSIMILLIFEVKAFAQTDVPRQGEGKNNNVEKFSLEVIKNKNATDVVVEGITIDKRVAKYYPEGALNNVPREKAIKLNHIYLDSYELMNQSAQNADCELKLKNEFDLGGYNHMREETARVEVAVNFKGCRFQIVLFSWKEIDDRK